MEDCLFCKIIAKTIPARIVYEDDKTLAFLDIVPRTTGHTMVIPKHHAPNLIELPESEVAPLFLTVKKMAELLRDKLAAEGITIGMNQGRASGQEVDHLHVHLMPRWKGDNGKAIQSSVDNPPKESLDDVLRRIIE